MIHHAPNQMDSQSADRPFYQGPFHLWFGSLQGIEGTAIILDLELDTRILPRKAHGNVVLQTVIVSIGDHVGYDFLQYQVHPKHELGREMMLRSKLRDDVVQPLDF